MSHSDPFVSEQYILLPSQGVRAQQGTEQTLFLNFPLTQSTQPSQAATLYYAGPTRGLRERFEVRYGPMTGDVAFAFGAPEIPLTVVDTVHEDGPKLVEVTESAALKLRLANPFVRLVPNRDYAPQQFSLSLPLSLPPGAGAALPTIIELRGKPANVPIAGTEVLALTDAALKLGDRGITDQYGRVELRLGPAPVHAEQLYVEPPPHGYWGAYRSSVTLSSPFSIVLEAVDLTFVDALRHHCGPNPGALDGRGVKVAVIDTGVDLNHPDLTVQGGANTVTGEQFNDYGDNGIGHGTHVAGIIAAAGVPPTGVRGLAPAADLLSFRVYGANTRAAKTYAIMKALIYAADWGCHLINLSLGAIPPDEALRDAIVDASDRGVVVIGAAGNDHRQAVSVPACYGTPVSALGRTGTFPAGAREQGDIANPVGTDPADFVADFSNIGPDIDFIAPGVGIVSTVPGGYAPGRGTSMAAAAATGMAARLLGVRPDLLGMPPDQARSVAFKNYLGTTARSMGFGMMYEGYGML